MIKNKRKKPQMIEIEVSNFCNLSCKICKNRNKNFRLGSPKFLSFKDFKIFMDNYDLPLKKIQFCGTSEPLTNKELEKMISYVKLKNKKIKTELITNGTLLNKKRTKQILNSGLDILRISIDGTTKEIYEKIRNFPFKILNNNLNNLKKELTNKTYFIINYTLTTENLEDVFKLPSFAKQFGAKEIEIRIFETNLKKIKSLAIHDKRILQNINKILKKKAKEKGIKLDFVGLKKIKMPKCLFLREAHINYNLNLNPCYHLPKKTICSTKGFKFSEIWNCEKCIKLEKKLNKKEFLKECNCILKIKEKKI